MDPLPIPPSYYDLERRHLEHTIDHDLHSLSFSSLHSSTSSSFRPPFQLHDYSHSFISSSSDLSLEYPRAQVSGISARPNQGLNHGHSYGPSGTPRAAGRMNSRSNNFGGDLDTSIGISPVSTTGHHASEITLGTGAFKGRIPETIVGTHDYQGFDPERSLGRLVGELGRIIGDEKQPPIPNSPFRSRPLPSLSSAVKQTVDPSFTLSNGDNILKHGGKTISKFNNVLHEQAQESGEQSRKKPLGPSTSYNISRTPATRKATGKGKVDRLRMLQNEGKKAESAPTQKKPDTSADVTGMTALMATPAKGLIFDSLENNGGVGGMSAVNIPHTLATLHARLRALEMESSVSRRRVKELEAEVEKANQEKDIARKNGEKETRESESEKSALEDLVGSLRANLARITLELEQHKALVVELRQADFSSHKNGDHSFSDQSMNQEIAALRQEIERLTEEIARLGCIVAEGIEVRRRTRGERTMNMGKTDMERLVKKVLEETSDFQRVKADMEKRKAAVDQSEKHELPIRIPLESVNALFTSIPQSQDANIVMAYNRSHASLETSSPSHAKQHEPNQPLLLDSEKLSTPSTSRRRKQEREESSTSSRSKPKSSSKTLDRGPRSPFPKIVGEDLEREFFSPSPKGIIRMKKKAETIHATDEMDPGKLPPQTVLARVIAELEGDFQHYKMVYSELADQYKLLDPASVSAKRHVLADHLREVIDMLELKAGQISDLYDLLAFEDKPIQGGGRDQKGRKAKSLDDVMRMVKASLGHEAWQRLNIDLKRGE
ncbi:hypothetical protein I307_03412 [Cryptococcus deuterogattii 99/473]|uniref:Cep57 centrosome microtubule-binding domain-containing protein n=1 Tax=Cryptococcus deuterogattii Ram5 TaxID=1296110 RepID=A0A0D0V7U2_9TREE|nr:hypothetical protein I313_00348 [Cryptococcus deuterogattii Ram5]KIY57078.1 hypothetical protein I307_03412 [Cryptococcus deuterogattii 99/473]